MLKIFSDVLLSSESYSLNVTFLMVMYMTFSSSTSKQGCRTIWVNTEGLQLLRHNFFSFKDPSVSKESTKNDSILISASVTDFNQGTPALSTGAILRYCVKIKTETLKGWTAKARFKPFASLDIQFRHHYRVHADRVK